MFNRIFGKKATTTDFDAAIQALRDGNPLTYDVQLKVMDWIIEDAKHSDDYAAKTLLLIVDKISALQDNYHQSAAILDDASDAINDAVKRSDFSVIKRYAGIYEASKRSSELKNDIHMIRFVEIYESACKLQEMYLIVGR